MNISGGVIENNTALGNGGGIYNYAGNLTLQGGVTVGPGNIGNVHGGGLYLGSKSTTTFNGCTISGNQADIGVGY